ncbi:hypothetical protein CYMTET_47315 [Cymbomonas tetramitiformis]|uniref:Uncharacterized protein n=1 Tax=Cymbomonas tetramitiformis TaxID=36881 RepID=A0AAE0BUI7_9CHLO|nr:hypothetical protein CYMTET_47315 [Cymbomonas tetramitiformis]
MSSSARFGIGVGHSTNVGLVFATGTAAKALFRRPEGGGVSPNETRWWHKLSILFGELHGTVSAIARRGDRFPRGQYHDEQSDYGDKRAYEMHVHFGFGKLESGRVARIVRHADRECPGNRRCAERSR